MEDKSWIKLYRKLKYNEVMRDPNALFLFTWILLSVDRKTGKWKVGRYLLGKLTGMKPTTVRDALYRLRDKYAIIGTQVTPTKYTEISVLKWDKYQQDTRVTPSYPPHSRHTDATYQEVENKRIKEINKEKSFKTLDKDELHNRILMVKGLLNNK